MPTFIQVFDNAGEAQLSGGSNFRGHIDWIELAGWNAESGSGSTSDAGRTPQIQTIQLYVRADDPILPVISNVVTGGAYTGDWSKATLDAFKDAQDASWYMRITFQNPLFTAINPIGSRLDKTPLMQATLEFTNSSIDYRDGDNKVSYFMPTGAIWDPTQQVCRVFDPNDAVSHLQE